MCIRYTYLRDYLPTVKYSLWILFARLFILVIISMLLSGCAIPVAPFYDEPLPKDRLTQIKAGANKDEVIQLFGEPHATRLDGKFWYYGGTRPLVFLGAPNASGAILDYNWIEVAFDDELRLQYIEHYESKSGCARSNNCLLWGEWDSVSKVMTDKAIFASPPDHDAAAKMFSPSVSGCAIYVFYTSRTSFIARSLLLDDVIAVSVRGSKPSWLNIDTYLRVEVPLGAVEISTGPMSKKQWNCETNDVSFFLGSGNFFRT
jgi:outer membrane protein assembly factor BamE (lipoprotein component of BamABCDE complex)